MVGIARAWETHANQPVHIRIGRFQCTNLSMIIGLTLWVVLVLGMSMHVAFAVASLVIFLMLSLLPVPPYSVRSVSETASAASGGAAAASPV